MPDVVVFEIEAPAEPLRHPHLAMPGGEPLGVEFGGPQAKRAV
jgi:hypothetical protein